jgi:3-dehydroquinate synthase
MKTIEVASDHRYEVKIGCDWREELLKALATRDRAAVIVSSSMRSRISELPSVNCEISYFEIPDGEAGKTTRVLLQVWDWLGAAGFTRSDLLIGIGGGAVTDLAGYAAASWLRGIDWLAIPTTVAGMVDAAIGGKTAINSDYGKNLIGAFYSPISVLIDPTWLHTLSDRDFAAGLAEVVKTGFIADPVILDLLEGRDITTLRKNDEIVKELIVRSVEVKASVVSEDFKESFAREALNYGHTLGHAVERDAQYLLRHGECVSIGMAFMAHLQYRLGIITQLERDRHLSTLMTLGLPIAYKREAWPGLLAAMSLDKKTRGTSLRFVILDGLGSTSRLENPEVEDLYSAYLEVSS